MSSSPSSSSSSPFIAYDVSLSIVSSLRELRVAIARRDSSLADQLSRAASSIPLNLAEGNRRVGKDRLHSFRVAAGSADGDPRDTAGSDSPRPRRNRNRRRTRAGQSAAE